MLAMEVFCFLSEIVMLVIGPLGAFLAYAFSAERSTPGVGTARMASTVMLSVLLIGALIAIDLKGLLFTVLVMAWGHDSPSTTEWQRFVELATPMTATAAATAAAVGAAWLWPRPKGCFASFPIAILLVVWAYTTWPQIGL